MDDFLQAKAEVLAQVPHLPLQNALFSRVGGEIFPLHPGLNF